MVVRGAAHRLEFSSAVGAHSICARAVSRQVPRADMESAPIFCSFIYYFLSCALFGAFQKGRGGSAAALLRVLLLRLSG